LLGPFPGGVYWSVRLSLKGSLQDWPKVVGFIN